MTQTEFWRSFAAEADELGQRLLDGETRAVFERVCELQSAHEIECCLDLTSDDTHAHLIFTPEGDPELAKLIDNLMRRAPELPRWKLFGRRQRGNLDFVRSRILEGWYLDPCDCSYQILYDGEISTVQMSMPDDPYEMTDDEKRGLINTFLWHAVGERFVMDNRISGEVLVAAEHCTLSLYDMIKELTGIKPD